MRQKTIITKLLQSVTGVSYNVRQVLQSATVITKWDVTLVLDSASFYKNHFLVGKVKGKSLHLAYHIFEKWKKLKTKNLNFR